MFDEERDGGVGTMSNEQVASGAREKHSLGPAGEGDCAAHVGEGWREIDRRVRRLARRRAALDAEEARLLIAARAAEVHKHLGYGSFDEYLERVLGYAPTTARDRMRVATALQELPEISAALDAGTITFSAAREITRVATAATEQAWLDVIVGLTAREIEDSVRGHAPGAHPDDRPDPQLEPRRLRMELTPDGYGLFLDARRALEGEVGHAMTDSDFMAVACRAALAGAVELSRSTAGQTNDADQTDDDGDQALVESRPTVVRTNAPRHEGAGGDGRSGDAGEPHTSRPTSNTPPHQIALTVCVDCKRGWQNAAGRAIEVSGATIERARCDATLLGRVDGAEPEPLQRSIPAAVRRMVLARDGHRCQVPGCRSSRFVDVHHIRFRADGGDHQPENLITACSAHHAQIHTGRIRIDGVPGALRVTHADGRAYGTPPVATRGSPPVATRGSPTAHPATPAARPVAATTSMTADAHAVLVTLGFRASEARAAVATAVAHVGDAPLQALLAAALRACPRPPTTTTPASAP